MYNYQAAECGRILASLQEPDPDVRVSVTLVMNAFGEYQRAAFHNGTTSVAMVVRGMGSLTPEERASLRFRVFVCPLPRARKPKKATRAAVQVIRDIATELVAVKTSTTLVCDEFLAVATNACLNDPTRWTPVTQSMTHGPMTTETMFWYTNDGDAGVTSISIPVLDTDFCLAVVEPYHDAVTGGSGLGAETADSNAIATVHASRSLAILSNRKRAVGAERDADIRERALNYAINASRMGNLVDPRPVRQADVDRFIPRATMDVDREPATVRRFSATLTASREVAAERRGRSKPADPSIKLVPYVPGPAPGELGYDAESEKLKVRIRRAVDKAETKRAARKARGVSATASALLAKALKEMSPGDAAAFTEGLDDDIRALILGSGSEDDESETSGAGAGAGAGSGAGAAPP